GDRVCVRAIMRQRAQCFVIATVMEFLRVVTEHLTLALDVIEHSNFLIDELHHANGAGCVLACEPQLDRWRSKHPRRLWHNPPPNVMIAIGELTQIEVALYFE